MRERAEVATKVLVKRERVKQLCLSFHAHACHHRSLLTLVPKFDSAQSYAPACNCNSMFIRAKPIYVSVMVYVYPIVVGFHRRLISILISIHGVKLDIQGFGLKG
jgi:hypothetical protein